MGANSGIEWTDHTFNPWWGCLKVSPACDHCYAESFAARVGFSLTGSQFPIWGGGDTKRRFFGDAHWDEPLKWNREAERLGVRHRVFCASMSDVMEDRRSLDVHRMRLYSLIQRTPNLDWLLLTKRPQNFRRLLPPAWVETPEPNVWLMTTVEAQPYTWRVTELLRVPAVVHGISYEPALGPLDLYHIRERESLNPLHQLNWVIAGGETGSGSRAPDMEWFRSMRDQCAAAGIAFLFKQWGEFAPAGTTGTMVRVGRSRSGRLLDSREHSEFPKKG